MKKKIALSLSALIATGLVAAEDLNSMLQEGKFDGYVRLHHINPSTSDTVAITGSFIGGKLKYETGALYGLSLGTAMYTSHDTGLTKWDYLTKDGYNQVAGGLAGNKELPADGGRFNNYTTIGEAYLNYKYSKTSAKIGRQPFASPMTTSEVTIIPNLYEAGVLTFKEVDGLTIQAAYLARMMYGTRATTEVQLIGDGVYGIVSGAGFVHSKPTEGKERFYTMGEAAFGANSGGIKDNKNDNGVATLSVEYDKGPIKLRVWDYYAQDMFNTAYADIDYKMDVSGAKLFFSAQALHQKDIGDFSTSNAGKILSADRTVTDISGKKKRYDTKLATNGEIDAFFWGLQAKAKMGDFMLNAAFTQNTKGHIIDPWGGNFGYTSTIFSRDENRAETDAYKLGFNYDFGTLGVKGLKFIYNYGAYKSDVETTATYTGATRNAGMGSHTEKSDEHDFMFRYDSPDVKGLWFTLFHVERDNDTRDYKQSHTRLVANLNF
ncbi:MAG: hypothetical protein RBR59_00235 [Sulfurimonadaceae bacterium]|jgi:hypothetical protein|nr:hypothetical protein [Sulfurimonadaceae bacterium]